MIKPTRITTGAGAFSLRRIWTRAYLHHLLIALLSVGAALLLAHAFENQSWLMRLALILLCVATLTWVVSRHMLNQIELFVAEFISSVGKVSHLLPSEELSVSTPNDVSLSVLTRGLRRIVAAIEDYRIRLTKANKWFADIISISGEWVWDVDENWNITQSSRTVENILGYSTTEMIQMKFSAIFPGGANNPYFRQIASAMERGELIKDLEIECIGKNGDKIIAEISALPKPCENSSGKEGCYGILRNVTESAKMLEAIERRNTLLETINFSTAGLLKASAADEVLPLLASKIGIASGAENLLICQFYHVSGKAKYYEWSFVSHQTISSEQDSLLFSTLGRKLQKGIPVEIKVDQLSEMERKHFELRGIETLFAVPILGPAKTLWGFIGGNHAAHAHGWDSLSVELLVTVADVLGNAIQRDMALAELVKSREWLYTTLSSIGEAIVVTDAVGKIDFINPIAEQLIGRPQASLSGLNVSEVLDVRNEEKPQESAGQASLLMRGIKTPTKPGHFLLFRNDGQKIPIDYSVAPIIDRDRNLLGSVIVLRDVGEQRRIEKLILEAKEQAEQANKAKSQFLANISHELRTPMNAIIGFSELLSYTALDKIQRDYADTIQSSASLLLSIITDILDVSKLEARNLELEHVPFNFRDMISSLLKISAVKLKSPDIELTCLYDGNLPDEFIGDPARMRQIFLNLLSNSVKFTERGEITLQISGEKHAANGRAGQFILKATISDTGIGIPKDKVKAVFEAFSQVETSISRNYGGTGLGLYITKSLVNKMGGKIEVFSDLGKGSTFALSIPLELPVEGTHVRIPNLSGHQVAFIGVKASTIRCLESLCDSMNIRNAGKFDSVEEALLEYKDKAEIPAMFICELAYPVERLKAFTSTIATLPFANKTKTLLMAYESNRIAIKKDELGFDAFIPKPLTLRQFAGIMEDLVSEAGTRRREEKPAEYFDGFMKGLSILVVEDNAVNRKLMKIIMEQDGAAVKVAENGREAITLLNDTAFDLIFMDIQMPVMDGPETAKYIRGNINSAIPIIAITATALQSEIAQALSCGMNDYMLKPIDIQKLRAKTKIWLNIDKSRDRG